MIYVRVMLKACGVVGVDNKYPEDEMITGINATWEEAQRYYAVGKVFNMGLWYDKQGREHEDNLMRVTMCELV